jgi:putative phage-type endonuclease
MPKIDLEQGSREWKDFRQTKITATDVPVILGLSPYTTKYELFHRKLGLAPEQKETPAMVNGRRLEPIARDEFIEESGIYFYPLVYVHDEYDYLMASLDGYSNEKNVVLEIKCNGPANHAIAMQGNVPDDHYCQMQIQMEVINAEYGYYLSYQEQKGQSIKLKVERNLHYFSDILPEIKEFHTRLITFDPPTPTESDYVVMITDKWDELAKKYIHLDDEIKRKEVEKDAVRKKLIELAGNQNSKGAGIKLMKTITKGRINYEAVPELSGLNLDKYRKDSTTSWRVYVD